MTGFLLKIPNFFKTIVNAGLVNENQLLKQKINDLEKLSNLDLTKDKNNGLFYKKDEKMPFCPCCYIVKKVSMQLYVDPNFFYLYCPNCGNHYSDDPGKIFCNPIEPPYSVRSIIPKK